MYETFFLIFSLLSLFFFFYIFKIHFFFGFFGYLVICNVPYQNPPSTLWQPPLTWPPTNPTLISGGTMPTKSKSEKTATRNAALDTLCSVHHLVSGSGVWVASFPSSQTPNGNSIYRYRLFILHTNSDGSVYPIDITTLVRDVLGIRWSKTYGYLMSYQTPQSSVSRLGDAVSVFLGQRVQYHSCTLF